MAVKKKYRIVIKLGSNVLTTHDGELDLTVLQSIVSQVSELKSRGHDVIMVSSGAVAAGKSLYTLNNVKSKTIQRQVYSAIGQVKLMNIYASLFIEKGLVCAQVLATREDFVRGMESYKNMRNCFRGLLKDAIIPIVNENDVVSLTELMFTDNDELAGLTAFMIGADKLLILSNINGLYTGHPDDADTKLIEDVYPDDKSVFKFISKKQSNAGRGGMKSKLNTSVLAADKGIETYMANGKCDNIVLDIMEGKKVGTKFHAKKQPYPTRHGTGDTQ